MKVRWYFYINHYPILYTNSFSYAILPTSHTERVWRDLIRSGRLLTVLDKLFFQVKSSHWGLIDENEHAIALEEKAQHIFDSSCNQEIIVTQKKKGYRNHEANYE